MIIYKNTVEYAEHIALVKGDVSGGDAVLVRVHAVNVLGDLIGEMGSSSAHDLHRSMEMIDDVGRGVVVLIRDTFAASISEGFNKNAPSLKIEGSWRDVGVGAQILLDLGVAEMILLSNVERAFVGLDGFGLRVLETRKIEGNL